MSEEIVEYMQNHYEDDICQRCQEHYNCAFNTNPYNLCEGVHCDNIYSDYLDDNMYEMLDKVCKEIKQLQQENKELKEDITWWSNRFNAVERDNRELKEKTKPYFKQKEFQEYRDKNKEIYLYLLEEKNNLYHRIDKAIKEIKKELEENHHLSYGVALTIINMLDGYKVLEGDK